jgi:hypothetical protein
MPRTARSNATDPEEQLRSFIERFDPKHRATIRALRKALRKRFPTATELVYDNYNFLVIGFGASERPSDCFISIAAASNGIGLCFIHGVTLPDPAGILSGSGKQTRFVQLPSADMLEQPELQALLNVAAEQARVALPRRGRGTLVIRSVSAKQRPRRSSQKAQSRDPRSQFRKRA